MNKNTVLLISAVVIAAAVWYALRQRTDVNGDKKAVDYTLAAPAASATPAPPTVCDALATWVSNPLNPPTEIPLGANAQLCQFYQFSWQWFISLMNVVGDSRVFQNEQNYPLLQEQGVNSCTTTGTKTRLFVRTQKDDDNPNDDFTLPERIGQALGDAAIYDQNGNVVFYEVRFSRDQCSLNPNTSPPPMMFPPGTTEIKVSYRVITPADKPNYVWINADINGDGTVGPEELLGMVGFHLVRSTALHPEFIWATFEHKQNVPDCQATPAPNPPAWSFTSAACAGQLPNPVASPSCNFNIAAKGTVLSGGPPTQICRVYHDGSRPGDDKFDINVANIDSLNTQLVGVNGFITALPDYSPLAVLKNYMLVGALWESDVTLPSSNLANQRGSIQLANTTMETTAQMAPNFVPIQYTGTSNLQSAKNCFGCHSYTPNNNVLLSHTFPLIHGNPPK